MTTTRQQVAVVVVAMVTGWLTRGVVGWLLLGRSNGEAVTAYAAAWPVLLAGLAVGLVAVAQLRRRGHFRCDEWWQAGWLVATDLLAMLVVSYARSGGADWWSVYLSLLAGPWLALFAAGSLAWRRLAPLAPPRAWLEPPEPEDT